MTGQWFKIGEVPAGHPRPRPIGRCEELESVEYGDVIAPLNEYIMVWDEDCVAPSQLEPWRREGDPLCDEVVEALRLRPGQDGLDLLLKHLDLPPEEQIDCVQEFWNQISIEPPPGISAFPARPSPDPLRPEHATPRQALKHPNLHPPPIASEGQAVFWRYSSQIFSALLHFSLAGGFSANKLVNVLRETNYLSGKDRDATYKRLLETTQAIMDYMNDLTPITGMGWKSAVRVRMLHSSVRLRITGKRGIHNHYDPTVDGVPINQEDLIATLGSFAIAPLWSLRRMGFTLPKEEEEAYVAAWRHVGYYLGISPDRLRHHYASVNRATKLFASNTTHLFSTDIDPRIFIDYKKTNTYRLLSAVANRPPRNQGVEHSLALSRILLGDGLADRLALPTAPTMTVLKIRLSFLLERFIHWFGSVYVSRWEVERVAITRMLIMMIVCWQLGVRRTKFTVKEFAGDSDSKRDIKEKAEKLADEKDKALDPDDDLLDPEVVMGPAAGRAIISRWKWMIGEMAAIVVVTGIVSGIALLGITKSLYPYLHL